MTDWSTLKKLIWLRIIKGGGSALRTVTGAIVHVTNALAMPAKALSVNVEPIQDLHGYDSPWPAGGGVNLANIDDSENGGIDANGQEVVDANNWRSKSFIPIKSGQAYTLHANEMTITRLYFYDDSGNFISPRTVSQTDTVTATSPNNAKYVKWTVYKSGITISDIQSAKVQLELGSTATAYAPYENICPISGRTSATVTRTGANVWDEEWELGSFNSQGQPSSSSTSIRCKNFIPVVSGQTYYMYSGSGKSNAPWMYGIDKSFIRRSSAYLVNQAFTIPEDVHYIKIALPGTYGTTYNHDISINYPATDTQYHPYQGNTYTIQLGDTVYGGTLDVTGGKMVVDRAMVDLGTLEYYYVSSGGVNAFRSNIGAMPVTDNSQHGITSIYPFAGTRFTSNMPNLSWMIDSQGRLFIRDYRYTDISSFVAYLSGQTIVYELATPIEITLTPTQIDMLLGENNLWADAGDLTLTYYADGNASTSEALGILLGGTYNNPGGADDVSDDEALEILLGGS